MSVRAGSRKAVVSSMIQYEEHFFKPDRRNQWLW